MTRAPCSPVRAPPSGRCSPWCALAGGGGCGGKPSGIKKPLALMLGPPRTWGRDGASVPGPPVSCPPVAHAGPHLPSLHARPSLSACVETRLLLRAHHCAAARVETSCFHATVIHGFLSLLSSLGRVCVRHGLRRCSPATQTRVAPALSAPGATKPAPSAPCAHMSSVSKRTRMSSHPETAYFGDLAADLLAVVLVSSAQCNKDRRKACRNT